MPGTRSIRSSISHNLKLSAARARHRAREVIGQYPSLYLPYARWKRREHGPVQGDTDAVIEGFPRSANTFAATAFELAQSDPVRLAHHLHVPSQIIAGARLGIPTMVLIRDPEEAVLSLLLWMPYVTPRQALKDYVRFYRRILPYRGRFVVAKFDDVSADFGAVIRRLNTRFGTSFKEFEHTRENVERCFRIIEQYHFEKDGTVEERRIARPSAQREVMKNELRAAFHSARLERVRRDAYALYDTLTSS